MKLRKSLFLKLIFQWKEEVKKLLKEDKYFVFWTSLLFYFFLYFNINNKTFLLLLALFVLILFARFKTLEKALFWGFIASLPFIVGKTYFFNLIPATKLLVPDNPEGYNLKFVITPTNIIAIFMFPLLLMRLIELRKKRRLSFDFTLFFLLLLIFLVFLSTVTSRNPDISLLYFLQFLQGPLTFLYARYLINWQKKIRDTFVFLLLSQAIFESFWVFGQFINNGPLGRSIESYQGIVPFGAGVDEDVWRYRPTGTFDHANYVAAFLLPIIILSFSAFYSRGQKYARNMPYFITAFVFGFLALIITLSRSAWISGFLGIFILTLILEKRYHFSMVEIYKKRLLFVLIFLLIVSPYFVLPRVISSFNTFVSGGSLVTRVELIKESLEVIRQNFFLGTGLGMSVPEMFENNPPGVMHYFPTPVHNWYLLLASEVGVLALLAFVFLLNFSLRRIFLTHKKDIFLAGVFVACLVMLINALFQPFLGGESLLFIFLGILASSRIKT